MPVNMLISLYNPHILGPKDGGKTYIKLYMARPTCLPDGTFYGDQERTEDWQTSIAQLLALETSGSKYGNWREM